MSSMVLSGFLHFKKSSCISEWVKRICPGPFSLVATEISGFLVGPELPFSTLAIEEELIFTLSSSF